jgi:hypothetical protein
LPHPNAAITVRSGEVAEPDGRFGAGGESHPARRDPVRAVTQGTAFTSARRHFVIAKWTGAAGKEESTMTSKTPNDENRPLADHDLDLIRGGFFLMELLVVVKEVAIIIGMNVPTTQKVRNA